LLSFKCWKKLTNIHIKLINFKNYLFQTWKVSLNNIFIYNISSRQDATFTAERFRGFCLLTISLFSPYFHYVTKWVSIDWRKGRPWRKWRHTTFDIFDSVTPLWIFLLASTVIAKCMVSSPQCFDMKHWISYYPEFLKFFTVLQPKFGEKKWSEYEDIFVYTTPTLYNRLSLGRSISDLTLERTKKIIFFVRIVQISGDIFLNLWSKINLKFSYFRFTTENINNLVDINWIITINMKDIK